MEAETISNAYEPIDKLCVLAPGLLGASVAMACRENRVAKTISIWSRRSSSRAKLIDKDWCDEVCEDPETAVEDADFVVICSPVDFIMPLFNEIKDRLKPGAVVTDVGSTKSLICRQAHAGGNKGSQFVGSHPMAGSEKTGMEHASEDLFNNRPCIVTPLEDSPDWAVRRVIQFWKALGSVIFVKSPEDHDEIVAHISHLPHVLASSLCSFLGKRPEEWRLLSSTGLRDATRIASGDPGLWKAIIETNLDEIKRAVADFQDELQRIQSALMNRNMVEVISILEKGKRYRDQLD